jgi:glycosyltransferase involved in cell wall biosynthesis
MTKKEIAIIIPAFKAFYLEQTLQSFVNQTNKNFTIYIGDDNSPENIESIVSQFYETLKIKYHKFNDNLGGTSLTKHWERCIELSDEYWIWLFSDDDLVDVDCVEKFYQSLDSTSQFYKFQTRIIDSDNRWIFRKYDKINSFNEFITGSKFISQRLNCNGFRSFAVEYVFSRELFDRYKIVDFPLAWASDDATWLQYSIDQGKIKCIPAYVSWRASHLNITSSRKNQRINNLKIDASLKYCTWLKKTASENNIKIFDSNILNWLSIQIASVKYELSFNNYIKVIQELNLNVNLFSTLKNFIIIKYYHLKNSIC